MVAVRLLRTVGAIEEEYGRIRFDGQRIYYDGLSSIFVKYLERGVMGADAQCYRPEHGIRFLENLKNLFSDGVLRVTDIVCE